MPLCAFSRSDCLLLRLPPDGCWLPKCTVYSVCPLYWKIYVFLSFVGYASQVLFVMLVCLLTSHPTPRRCLLAFTLSHPIYSPCVHTPPFTYSLFLGLRLYIKAYCRWFTRLPCSLMPSYGLLQSYRPFFAHSRGRFSVALTPPVCLWWTLPSSCAVRLTLFITYKLIPIHHIFTSPFLSASLA